MPKQSLALLLLVLPLDRPACADTPAFDRPGAGFSVTTLPACTFAWEQGLPDMSRNKSGGTTATRYSADARIRAGLIDNLELQLTHAPYNYLRASGRGQTRESEGASGIGISLKYALPDLSETLSWAVLGGTTVDTGNEPFSPGEPVYTLGTTLAWQRHNDHSLSLYVNVDQSGSDTTTTLAPAYSVAVNRRLGSYVELELTRADGVGQILLGGGVTWMATEIFQLDLYANIGVDSDSNDLEAGFGLSLFID